MDLFIGLIVNPLSIIVGCLIGSFSKKNAKSNKFQTLGISVMALSLVGFFENMYNINGKNLESANLIIVLLAFIVGNWVGNALHIEDRISNLSKTNNVKVNAFLDTTLFFGVGGLQISGPIALALTGSNSQLFIKSLIDFPFAIIFGAAYGSITLLSSVPVAIVQVLIWLIALLSANFFSTALIMQICATGYIILFFSGYNLFVNSRYKIDNINMLPSIFFVIILNALIDLFKTIF